MAWDRLGGPNIYRSSEVARYGLIDWDPGWYGGTYPLNYSLLYPLAAAYLGLWPLAALSSAGAAVCFDRLVSADPKTPKPQNPKTPLND